MNFTPKIAEMRVYLGITQQELADSLGVAREIVAHWERGTRQVKAYHLLQIAQQYGISVDWLLGLSDEPMLKNNSPVHIRIVANEDDIRAIKHQVEKTLIRIDALLNRD